MSDFSQLPRTLTDNAFGRGMYTEKTGGIPVGARKSGTMAKLWDFMLYDCPTENCKGVVKVEVPEDGRGDVTCRYEGECEICKRLLTMIVEEP